MPFWNLLASARRRSQLSLIESFGPILQAESDARLAERCLSLRYRARRGESPVSLLPETYSLVREAATRTVQLRHFDVQLLAGMVLCDSTVAEIETGEGKTLVATLPLSLMALSGQGALLATANDYLAGRDAAWMGPVYRLLGLTVGTVLSGMSREERRAAYNCDITYGTAREFGFDFLRDRLEARSSGAGPFVWMYSTRTAESAGGVSGPVSGRGVQREPHFIIVDEADSLLIDEARTPLIISGQFSGDAQATSHLFCWCAREAVGFRENLHFECDDAQRLIELTPEGREHVRSLPLPAELNAVPLSALYEQMEQAVLVLRNFHRDRHYVVRGTEVVIVDEFTGRLAEGRRWQAGIHQAVEAKEGLPITRQTGNLARITVQDFFLRFPHLSGMTGTARPAARELRKLYRLRTLTLPPHLPSRRLSAPPRVFASTDEKWRAISDDVARAHSSRRPVLIGTRSIEASEIMSRHLHAAGIAHQVLNARHPDREAGIIAQAGQPGQVTVATNMAGRGTDIKLGEGVSALGGLLVIGTEMHESARIDRQLAGRCGRQGDPGEFRQFAALDDELLSLAFGREEAERIANRERDRLHSGAAPTGRVLRLFQRAQQRIERKRFRERVLLQQREHDRHKSLADLGQDPYLDSPD